MYCDPCKCEDGKANLDGPRTIQVPFKIEAVIICDQYHDFLAHTVPANKFVFDRLVVVTSPEDRKTQRICEYHHVQCIQTDAIRSRWKEFCKGAAINEGLEALSLSCWAVHLDADILLPPQTRGLIEKANLDPTNIYGIDRFNVKGYAAFDEFRSYPQLQHENDSWVHLNAFPVGTRVMKGGSGYVPIGFFQMWNPEVSGINCYPEGHKDAGREDFLFAQHWPRSHRAMIPEIIGYHLESEDAQMGANWEGRKTKQFTYNP
jgi:hypothetical protein